MPPWMAGFLDEHGLLALFVTSFLAATVLPVASEAMLLLVLERGAGAVLAVAVATVGNTLGALTTYGLGRAGGALVLRRVLRIDDAARERADRTFARFGTWTLLFAWLPFVGDPLCAIAGVHRVRVAWFVLLAGAGKLARYAAVALAAA